LGGKFPQGEDTPAPIMSSSCPTRANWPLLDRRKKKEKKLDQAGKERAFEGGKKEEQPSEEHSRHSQKT